MSCPSTWEARSSSSALDRRPIPETSVAPTRACSSNDRGIDVLSPSPAQSRNGLVVEEATATEHGLRTISDLRAVASGVHAGRTSRMPGARALPARAHARLRPDGSRRSCRWTPADPSPPKRSNGVPSTWGCSSPATAASPSTISCSSPTIATCSPRRTSFPSCVGKRSAESGPALTQVLDGGLGRD